MSDEIKYAEACNALRHYSNCVMHVRTTALIQGLVVLGSMGYLFQKEQFLYAAAVALFGFGMTIILSALNYNYYKHFNTFLIYVTGIENGDTCKKNDKATHGPWSRYHCKRNENENDRWWYKPVCHDGVFWLLVVVVGILMCVFIYCYLIC